MPQQSQPTGGDRPAGDVERRRRRLQRSLGRGRRLARELVDLWYRVAVLDDDGAAEFYRILHTYGIDLGPERDGGGDDPEDDGDPADLRGGGGGRPGVN